MTTTKKSECTNDKCSLFGKCSLGVNCQLYKGVGGKGNKYHAQKCEYEGMVFDSKAELDRWLILRLMERGGMISKLQRQVKYELLPAQKDKHGKTVERALSYIADFVYTDKSGKTVVEDCKGYKGGGSYSVFTIKRKLLLWKYGIQINEV